MSPQKESALRAVLIAVGTALLLATVTAGWAAKENTADHASDVAKIDQTLQRLLDAYCEDRPSTRACK